MSDKDFCGSLLLAARTVSQSGLSQGKTGNVSVRRGESFLVTPTGISADQLTADQLVEVEIATGNCSGGWRPSSEWPFHRGIYQAKPGVGAIVHVHSPYATALASAHREIPAFHYMVAIAGGNSIPCVPYAPFGTEALAELAVAGLKNRTACLLANHGMIATGDGLESALALAFSVEEIARHYQLSLQIGGPVLLTDADMADALQRFRNYGQQGSGEP